MLSNKPYLIDAFYRWIVDSQCTPLLTVNTLHPRCQVPEEYVENNEITLNVAPEAVRDFKIGKDRIDFRASFSGVVHIISVPVTSVLAVYAEENGEGMFFDYEDSDTDDASTEWKEVSPEISAVQQENKAKVSHLKLVE